MEIVIFIFFNLLVSFKNMENEWIVQNKKFLELAGQFSVEASEYESPSAEVRTVQ